MGQPLEATRRPLEGYYKVVRSKINSVSGTFIIANSTGKLEIPTVSQNCQH
ncbi:20345_t:CDS:2 [Cetraspora pellucida]|uniref:20345_t:CDS:1 n=1 Tax=Cetraspora pellucida TaxID=1433469 RepID=A0A9N9BC76_9GLOM|nr:20345_t:CDS:2 [Cetraspora pellucida]